MNTYHGPGHGGMLATGEPLLKPAEIKSATRKLILAMETTTLASPRRIASIRKLATPQMSAPETAAYPRIAPVTSMRSLRHIA